MFQCYLSFFFHLSYFMHIYIFFTCHNMIRKIACDIGYIIRFFNIFFFRIIFYNLLVFFYLVGFIDYIRNVIGKIL